MECSSDVAYCGGVGWHVLLSGFECISSIVSTHRSPGIKMQRSCSEWGLAGCGDCSSRKRGRVSCSVLIIVAGATRQSEQMIKQSVSVNTQCHKHRSSGSTLGWPEEVRPQQLQRLRPASFTFSQSLHCHSASFNFAASELEFMRMSARDAERERERRLIADLNLFLRSTIV